MANDRIFLRCDKCGDANMLLLYTASGTSTLDTYRHEEPAAAYFWLKRHEDCHPDPYGDCGGIPGFAVVTESTSDEVKFETVPCDHPQWKALPKDSRKSQREHTTRKECTTCGHKVTHIKRLVAREHLMP